MGKALLRPPMPTVEELNQLIALFNAGRLGEVESRTRLLVERYPDSGFAWKLLGATQHRLGKDALPALKKAARLLPGDAEAQYNLGVTQKSLGQLEGAVASYRRALELKPDSAGAHNNLGVALKDLGQLEAALASYRKAIEPKPGYADAHNNLGIALKELGQFDAALASCRRAQELQPQVLQHAIYAHLLLPVILETLDSIVEWRERYQNGIAELMNMQGTLDEPGDKLGSTSFYLAYHNADDRPLMEALCRLFHTRVPDLTATAPHVPGWRPPG